MGDTQQTAALIVAAQEYRGDVVRQINRRATVLKTLKIVAGAGPAIGEVAEGDGAIAENMADGAAATNFGSDSQDPAIYHWALYRGLFHVTNHARRVASSSATPAGLRNLLGRNMANSTAKLASFMNASMYTGAGTGTLVAGFDQAFADDNTYATINRLTGGKEFWRSNVFDPGSLTALSFAQIRKDLSDIYTASGEVPDVAYCSPDVYNAVAALFDANRRYNQEITTARGLVRLDSGYGAIEVDGCMFLRDKDAPANTIYYVNTAYTEIQYLPIEAEVMAAIEMLGVELSMDDGYGSIPLGIAWEEIARLGGARRYEGCVEMQLKCARPNSCGRRLNVAV